MRYMTTFEYISLLIRHNIFCLVTKIVMSSYVAFDQVRMGFFILRGKGDASKYHAHAFARSFSRSFVKSKDPNAFSPNMIYIAALVLFKRLNLLKSNTNLLSAEYYAAWFHPVMLTSFDTNELILLYVRNMKKVHDGASLLQAIIDNDMLSERTMRFQLGDDLYEQVQKSTLTEVVNMFENHSQEELKTS